MYKIGKKQRAISLISILLVVTTAFSGCDFSAKWDLKRAEKALNSADKYKASFWAEREYTKAQKAFDEACILAREGKVNEARDMAQNAKEWAIEAMALAQAREEEMEKERDGLGTYKE
ncbi:MAG: DUF4398 domain-containing protein [Calditrichaeota bacterium]|jgi:hypothetical protein|nr:DUF4398 domain-containing protein [Calditrichota bacterium]MBT7618287.1 DUF4398 domain-containing protein [Calditrichota bacterium]MBT7787320.1 DUF4398 domain-containing protein [Calditrichota bacterium]